MINTYSFYDSEVNKLNEFVLAFFNRIEFETGDFSVEFFKQEFYDNLVSRHTGILLKPFRAIYTIFKDWNQNQRTEFCKALRDSNEIEQICIGTITPMKGDNIPDDLRALVLNLFKQLYKDVLFGEFFTPNYGNRKVHYNNFRRVGNNSYSMCPACGIRPMHNSVEDITDQYDHYLPKDIYPLSSVNFKNLVPVCSDCNSILVKSNDDILSHTGKVFYPYDETHKPIEYDISIAKNNTDNLEAIEWTITYICETGKDDELAAWKNIYNIESRHQKYCQGNMTTWFKFYWENFTDSNTIDEIPNENNRKNAYLRTKRTSSPFEYQCLSAILTAETEMAIVQSNSASRYN